MMKYMGSKRKMLQNGLGTILLDEGASHNRVIDLFSGSAAVTWFVAQHLDKRVVAIDLQKYSQVLADSVIGRTRAIQADRMWAAWMDIYKPMLKENPLYEEALLLHRQASPVTDIVRKARNLCYFENRGVIWNSYGGYYFSPLQALELDTLLNSIPFQGAERNVALASVIVAASKCSASPGHTAQPFSPKGLSGRFLKEAWMKDPVYYAKQAFYSIAGKYAHVRGNAIVGDALEFSEKVAEGDLVFIDPPYSSVHYSRFYHVLETIARGHSGPVNGRGRYPPIKERPVSTFSRKSESVQSFEKLISTLSERRVKVILTYPDKDCSNGLSGRKVIEICAGYFSVKKKIVKSFFSTLGGNNRGRAARQIVNEMILVLESK